MNTIKFIAKTIHSEKNNVDKYYMVSFADDKFNYKNYLIVQKAFKFDEDDFRNNMDGEYLEVNGQGNSSYKICEKVTFTDNWIEFKLLPNQIDYDNIIIDISKIKISSKDLKYLQIILEKKIVLSENN